MITQNEIGPSPAATPALTDKVTFQDVVAYLHGVTDAVQAMQKSCLSVRPGILEASIAPLTNAEVALLTPDPPPSSRRITVRHGETEIELEGRIVVRRTPFPLALANRNGARLVDFEGAPRVDANDAGIPGTRSTLPYGANAISIAPFRLHAGNTERPTTLEDQNKTAMQHYAYSALAVSLVPIAPAIPSAWPVEGDEGERVSGIRLRAALPSAELYALTGTNDHSG